MSERIATGRDSALGAALRGVAHDAAAWAGAATELGQLHHFCTSLREKPEGPVVDTTFVDPRKRKRRANGETSAQ